MLTVFIALQVTSVTIGHDGRGTGSGWFLEFVSIYVESMNEYYVFSSNDSVWIKKNKDVVLPLKGWLTLTFSFNSSILEITLKIK